MSKTYRKRKECLLSKYPYVTFIVENEKIIMDLKKWTSDSEIKNSGHLKIIDGCEKQISYFESDSGTKRTDKSFSKRYRKMTNNKRKNKDKRALYKELSLYEYNDFKGDYALWNGKDSVPDVYFWD